MKAFEVLKARAPNDSENNELEKLFNQVKGSNDAPEAFRFLVVSLITDPEFVYMQEGLAQPDASAPDFSYENRILARRISFALTGLPPDSGLRKFSSNRNKISLSDWKSEIDRISATPQASAQFNKFVRDWLDLKPLVTLKPNPPLDQKVAIALDSDFDFTVQSIFNSGLFSDLISGNTTYLKNLSAKHYGLSVGAVTDNSTEAPRLVTFDSNRRGIISLAPFLASHAATQDSHPVRRGRMIRERFLCQPIDPPDENIPLENPASEASESLRERFVRHSKEEACASCHKFMDSLGFSLESFDQVGLLRSTQNGFPIDTSGRLDYTKTSNNNFNSWVDLSTVLSEGNDVKRCFLQNYVSYLADDTFREVQLASVFNELQNFLKNEKGSLQKLTSQIVGSNIVLGRKTQEPEERKGSQP
jgi:hypothetical protein